MEVITVVSEWGFSGNHHEEHHTTSKNVYWWAIVLLLVYYFGCHVALSSKSSFQQFIFTFFILEFFHQSEIS